jgi:CheY-like chemotaxis protein
VCCDRLGALAVGKPSLARRFARRSVCCVGSRALAVGKPPTRFQSPFRGLHSCLPVAPEILIVGDEPRRTGLARRVAALGYDASGCAPDALTHRLGDGPVPAAIMVCAMGADAAVLMAELRRSRQGAAIPVTLCGRLGGAIRDLADVLDLGADHFLEEPIGEEQLAAALEALAGSPPERGPSRDASAPVEDPPAHGGNHRPVHDTAPQRTEIIGAPEASMSGSAGTSSVSDRSPTRSHADPTIGQLHRTLDMLEERLRARANESGDSADDMDLSMLGLEAVPDIDDAIGEILDPADSALRLELGRRVRANTIEVPDTVRSGPREPTLLLEGGGQSAGALHAQSDASSSWRDVSSSPTGFDEVHDESSPLHDRPRRSAPLPVDRNGRLDRIEVPRLLWKLHRAHYDGRLTLRRGRVEKRLWFDAGTIVFARSNVGHDRLIDGLMRRGLLSRGQYEAARRLAAKEPRRAGRLLVEAGFLRGTELPRAIREHLVRIIDSTFSWNEGTWELTPGEACDEPVLLDQPTPLLLAEGIRHRLEVAQLWALLGGPRQHASLRPRVAAGREAELAESLLMPRTEEALLPKLDGKTDLGTLGKEPGVDEAELLGLVYALHVLELVDLTGEAAPQPLRTTDPGELDRERITDRLLLVREADYFEVLGLSRDATRADVRRAYTDLAQTFSDDALEPTTREAMGRELDEIRAALAEARRILADDDLRGAYLAHLEAR